jgi:penicillin amidase
MATPRDAILAQLIQEPNSAWWDRRATPETRETRDVILRTALADALRDVTRRYGPPNGGGWRWDRVQQANIFHLLRIPAFSALDLAVPGGRATLSPMSGDGTQGASWRMVVDLGPELVALGTYPGGQSGNPVSPRYLDRLGTWMAGRLDTLRTPRTPADLAADQISATLTLVPQ